MTVETAPFVFTLMFQVPYGSRVLNPVNVYVVLEVPHVMDWVVPSGAVIVNVKGELPLLTLQFTVTEVILLFVP